MAAPGSTMALTLWRWLERGFDPFFAAANPLRHLGALACLCLLVLAISGIYLYVMLETSVAGAWFSIDALSQHPRAPSALLRSLHRYAADALMLCTLAHLLREWLHGHYRRFRAYSWWTGTGLLPLLLVSAIGGFWLNWDALGQYSVLATAEWLDWWPLFASPLTRNFLDNAAVSDRLFSLLVFVHLGVPLLLLFLLWAHLQRISRALVLPPRGLLLGALVTLLALAIIAPVRSQAPADLALLPHQLDYDWILLFIHPLTEATSAGWGWAMLLGGLLLVLLLPLLDRGAAVAPALVDGEHCNGCGRCVDDCPYSAVDLLTLAPGRELAVVDRDLCAGCGICVGSCPSSTPFRRVAELRSGIELPQTPIHALRLRLQSQLAAMPEGRKWVLYGCDHGVDVHKLAQANVAGFSLPCSGMLPPSFVEYALRDGADGVLVVGCRAGDCEFRHGQAWTAQRLAGRREPHLRRSVAHQRYATLWAAVDEDAALAAALRALQQQVAELPAASASVRQETPG